ncbi:MAG: thioredoxin [Nanoarchaeota archaeon]|nr:thioredoxin [Nanoarchaeota archaeon]MBU1103497.1 thioredoxin [Nanoarchaeota archaeon]
MAGKVTELDVKNFDKFVREDKVVVDFYAEWCGPCKMMAPVLEETAGELRGKAKFGKVDVDENSELAQRFQVMSIPTLIFFRDGKQVDQITGLLNKEELVKKVGEIK